MPLSAIEDSPYDAVRAQCVKRMHKARSLAQADVYVLDWDGRPAVLKDFSLRPAWFRRMYARRLVAREIAALRWMEGIGGVPRVLATAGPLAFVMERLDAQRLPHHGDPPPPPDFWTACRALIESMHERGIAHGDLRRKNILIDRNDGSPCLIDFATAWRWREGEGFFGAAKRFMFRRVLLVDRVTFARIKKMYAPDSLDATERKWLAAMPWWLRAGRMLKNYVYKWRKPRVIKRRMKAVLGKSKAHRPR